MDREILKEFIDLMDKKLDEKLEPIKNDITSMKKDITGMQSDITSMKKDITGMQSGIASMKKDITVLKSDTELIKTQQKEQGQILRIIEDKAVTNKAEHDKIINDIAQLSGKVEDIRKDLIAVEVVTARNMENIAALKIIK